MSKKYLLWKRALRSILLVLLLNVAGMGKYYAQTTFTVDNLNYSINVDFTTVTLTGHVDSTSATGLLVIPDMVTYDGTNYSVTEIYNQAFAGCSGFTEVHYNATNCEYTGWYGAFQGCGGNLIIGNNVERIPTNIFKFAEFTGSLNIPNSVTSIGEAAFFRCSGFTGDLVIPSSVIEIGTVAFGGCSGFTGRLTIPNSLASIGKQAFDGCSSFTEVIYNATNCEYTGGYGAFQGCGGNLTIGNNVERIPSYLFREAAFTGSLTIPNSVTTIGEGAFYNCSGFSGNLTIGNSVTMIGAGAFGECRGFTAVYYTGSITQWYNISFENVLANPLWYAHNLYINNELVTDLIIPEGITEIKPCTFCWATCLTSLTLPNSLNRIGDRAFWNCINLTGNLIIPSSVTYIGRVAFASCGFTGPLILPNALTSIEYDVFFGCNGFTGSLVIPNSVTTIGNEAFAFCTGFTGDLVIPESVTRIAYRAFYNCSGFSKVHFNPSHCDEFYEPNFNYNWNELPPFEGCGGSLEISENMQDIPPYLFKKAHFKEVTMYYSEPSILHNTIGTEAFAYCDSLKSIICYNEEPPMLADDVFEGVNKDCVLVHVPCGKAIIYKTTDGWRKFPNYEMHLAAWLLKVTANDPAHCEATIKQLPVCESGEVIVRAKPAPGYKFLGWYEDDERVSQDTLYAFYLATSRELEARVRSITGLEDMATIEANVYPNPTKGHVHIEAESIRHVTISNMLGQQIYNGKANGNEFEYDFGRHSTGLYLIRIETANGMAVKKVSVAL